ncbi:Simvastatin synthase [Nemania serpens]|nr:Simvastatin synthase [Nemania serpens]
MEEIDKTFRQVVRDGRIYGAVLRARDRTGGITGLLPHVIYGVRSLRVEDPEKRPPIATDTPMRVASCFKFLTPPYVERLLPEVAGLGALTGFDESGNSIEREPKSPVLLKYLLSHNFGLCYTLIQYLLWQYRKLQSLGLDKDYDDTLERSFKYPLLFDPRTNCAYTSGVSAEVFLQKHIVILLGIGPNSMTFSTPVAESKGLGSYAPHILTKDGKLLKPETWRLLFEQVLTPEAEKASDEICKKSLDLALGVPIPLEIRRFYSVGGTATLRIVTEIAGIERATLSWSGLPNINIDDKAGICFWAFYLRPFGDPICVELGTKFEEVVFLLLEQ